MRRRAPLALLVLLGLVFVGPPLYALGEEDSSETKKEASSESESKAETEPKAQTPPAPEVEAEEAPTSTADIDVGHVFPFDLEAGRIAETLPFDVQFFLRTPVDATVTNITGRYVGDRVAQLCAKAFPRTRLSADYGYGPRDLAPLERRQIQPIGFSGFVTVEEERHADLSVLNGLLPNRHYCFEFKRTRKLAESPKEVAKAFAGSVDRVMRSEDEDIQEDPSRIPLEIYLDLREAVTRAVQSQARAGERLIIQPGSFLDPDTKAEDLPAAAKQPFSKVLEAQLGRADQIDSLRDFARGVTAQLATLEAVATAKRSAEETPAVSSVLEDIAKGALSASKVIADIVKGSSPSIGEDEARPLDEVWTRADLEDRVSSLSKEVNSLVELEKVVGFAEASRSAAQTTETTEGFEQLASKLTLSQRGAERLVAQLNGLGTTLDNRQLRLGEFTQSVGKEVIDTILLEGTTNADFEVRANWYLSMDIGAAWAEDVEDFFLTLGTNIYFRPVNKRAPLRWSDFRKGQRRSEFFKRFSVTVGITVNELDTEDDQFQSISLGLVADRPLIFAGGFRLNDFFRLSAGALVFKDRNPDPLLDEDELAWAPLVAVSIDFNLAGAFRNRLNPNLAQ